MGGPRPYLRIDLVGHINQSVSLGRVEEVDAEIIPVAAATAALPASDPSG